MNDFSKLWMSPSTTIVRLPFSCLLSASATTPSKIARIGIEILFIFFIIVQIVMPTL